MVSVCQVWPSCKPMAFESGHSRTPRGANQAWFVRNNSSGAVALRSKRWQGPRPRPPLWKAGTSNSRPPTLMRLNADGSSRGSTRRLAARRAAISGVAPNPTAISSSRQIPSKSRGLQNAFDAVFSCRMAFRESDHDEYFRGQRPVGSQTLTLQREGNIGGSARPVAARLGTRRRKISNPSRPPLTSPFRNRESYYAAVKNDFAEPEETLSASLILETRT